MRNSHRDLFPNIDTAFFFCNIGMEKPHKHWVYAVSAGGDGEIRTHVPVRANAFRVRPVMTTSIRLRVC